MPGRASSPALSENEVDIAGSLFAHDAGSDSDRDSNDDSGPTRSKKANGAAVDLDFGDLLNAPGAGDSDDGGDDEDFIARQQRSSNRKASNLQGKTVKKGGGFQAMAQDNPLILERRDVVGMARTGSGKTAAFVIPMIERLKAHSARVGARALILSPSRELALQTLKVVKELGKGTDLRTVLLVGGDSLEEQFGLMAANPDIVIATPGRFLHLKVEMSLDLSSIKYVVFDEADRLFEMGFATQLTEILHALPPSRQTLLFSATLPSSLVEFARAGLQEPTLVRLDAETKVSPDLESAFFSVKGAEKEGALLHILHDVIKMPLGPPAGAQQDEEQQPRKRKRGSDKPSHTEKPTEHSTIIFTATKHHVEYLSNLLRHAGFSVSYVYGSLDQTARKIQVDNFRRGRSNILVVTDVAARGIDIPVLANVINYDFPLSPKSLSTESAERRVLASALFLGRKLVLGQETKEPSFARDVVVGSLMRAELENNTEWVNKLLGENEDMSAMKRVTVKAEKLYMKTRNSASSQSAKRAREIIASKGWTQLHALFGESAANAEEARDSLLSKISSFKPQETIFEIGPRGKSAQNKAAEVMRSFRAKVGPRRKTKQDDEDTEMADAGDELPPPANGRGSDEHGEEEEDRGDAGAWEDEDDGSESDSELEVTVTSSRKSKKGQTSFEDPEVFMSYTPRTTSAAEERAYGVHSGGSKTSHFVEAARDAAMDLTNDEGAKAFGLPTRPKMRWDKRHSKYVARANDDDGSRGAKMIRGESGVKIAASFQSGRFDKWRRAHRLGRLPQVGEAEQANLVRSFSGGGPGSGPGSAGSGFRFKHKQMKAPKDADKYRDDYHVRKRRVAEAREKRIGKYRDGEGSRRELKSAADIRKARQLKERRKEKNARPAKKGKR
ncbi:48bbb77c-f1e1-412f-933f-3b1d8f73d747 [Thermothielavioides terrestris]|uniref:RNA helicase n=1 Tax=Thermothielavioides terrestris TaxID=2587410 RepID=A0A446BBS4_9PEZI|nr:48bbb77c-f1e1-412f-933f-3b1d8f73d747 [Thermothielavioides terrestris]